MSKNEEVVHVDNIKIGYVGLFENQCTRIKVLRKIMFAKILDEDHIGLNCSNQAISYGIITPTGPKKIGVDDLKKGVDLCEKINGKKIIYPVTEANSVDGDIIIFDTMEVGVFLRYIGFPLQLDRKNLKIAQKILLEPKTPIIRRRTPVMLDSSFEFDSLENFDIDQFNQLKEIIEPFNYLKGDGNPIRVCPEERAFAKKRK